MTTMLPQQAQAAYRMARAERAAERYRVTHLSGRGSRGRAGRGDTPARDRRGPPRAEPPMPRAVNGAAASSAFATGRG